MCCMNDLKHINFFPNPVTAFFTKKSFDKHHCVNDLAKLIVPNKTINLVFQKQTHSDNVLVVEKSNFCNEYKNTDGLITQLKNHLLLVYTADCTPILLYDKKNQTIAAVHSGWKGTAQNIVGKTIAKMGYWFGSNPKDIMAYLGPAISQKNYEVGRDVFEAFQQLPIVIETIFKPLPKSGKYLCDVRVANQLLMLHAGLQPAHISGSALCSFDHPELLYSARREGSKIGRTLSGIVVT